MGVDREHLHRRRTFSQGALAASAVAAALVRRDALRLCLSARAALWDSGAGEILSDDRGARLSSIYRFLLLPRHRRGLSIRTRGLRIARRGLARRGGDGAAFAVVSVSACRTA